ncbi:hypothetical protein JT359_18065 [Candidatus Poribacteria bacterium]|nr:hypothetical protein [Candidatus Poribacteria bacterium]
MKRKHSPIESNVLLVLYQDIKGIKQGIKTPKKELDLIHKTLNRAKELAHEES